MRKIILLLILCLCINTLAGAEEFRLGIIGSVELMDKSYDEIVAQFGNKSNIIPGVYWEAIYKQIGFGMTYYAKFDANIPTYPDTNFQWSFAWISSFDIKYHFIKDFFIDPFIGLSLGCAGGMDLGDYDNYQMYYDSYSPFPVFLSIFSQVGIGAALLLEGVHLGLKMDYRLFNEIPPVTFFQPYPLKNFQFSLFGGFSIK